MRNFPEPDIAIFIHENCVDPKESIYRFTDNTRREREEIIKWISIYGRIPEIEYIYPALNQYLGDYTFDCGKLSESLTSYFKNYRMQKLTNCIYPEFLEQVYANAKSLPYTHLETRDSAILRIEDKKSAFLDWIDALGVEYLPYITALARKKGLSMHVDIAYSQLPTITSINRGFYDNRRGSLKKEKNQDLDDI
ncbi:MAG: BREX-4 system phosphatase PglZ, partial [Eubacteriales bacterium]